MTRALAPAIVLIAGLVLAAPAAADQVVYFVNGKAMTVKKVEKGDRITILEVDGGGRIGIPTEQIARIEELQLPSPAAPAAAPPPPVLPAGVLDPQGQSAAAAPAAGAAAVATPVASPGTPVGPSIGGKPTQPGRGLAGLQPLGIGAAEGDGATRTTAPRTAPAPGTTPTGVHAAQNAGHPNALARGPGAMQPRRFNARGGAYGRARPTDLYMPPPAAGADKPAATAGKPSAPAAETAAPAPPPNPDPPAADPPPETAEPAPGGDEDTEAPVEPPADDSTPDEDTPEN